MRSLERTDIPSSLQRLPRIIEKLPEGHAKLVDQLRRAAISIAREAKELLEKVVAILSSVCKKKR